MMGGPSVRRIHRERENKRNGSRRVPRYAFRGPRPRRQATGTGDVGPRVAPVPQPAARPVPRAAQPAALNVRRRPNTASADPNACPIRIQDLLDLQPNRDVAVIGDQILVGNRGNGTGNRLKRVGSLRGRLNAATRTSYSSLQRWASGYRRSGGRYGHLDTWGEIPGPETARAVERFVYERLIPRLSDQSPAESVPESPPASPSTELDTMALDGLEEAFCFSEGVWHELVSYYGAHSRGPVFRVEDGCYLAVRSEPQTAALRRYNRMLEESVRRAVPRAGSAPKSHLFRKGDHSVIETPLGKTFLCRKLSPFAVEAEDGRLYYFDEIEYGIEITGTETRDVIRPNAVLAMHPYRHMFVSNLGNMYIVCMPRAELYYRRLYQLDLETAMLEHLESARMTLCAGYDPASSFLHPIQTLGREVIGEKEAAARKVTVYPYYRPQSQRSRRRK